MGGYIFMGACVLLMIFGVVLMIKQKKGKK